MHAQPTNAMRTVNELSTIAAENNPHREAFADTDRRLTWSEFDAESNRLANAFREHITQGDRVAFVCESSVDHITAMNGAIKAGAIVSNLHVRASPETFRYCIDTIRPRVLVLDEAYSEFFEERVAPELTTDIATIITLGEPQTDYEQSYDTFRADQPATAPDVRITPDDIAAVWWTSGTTGKPKGWCHTHRGIMLKVLKTSTTGDRHARSLVVLSPGFAAWWGNVMSTLVTNGAVVFRRDWDPEDVPRLVEEEELTTVGLVTTMWREILRLDDLDSYDLSSLETIASTGETLDPTTIERLENQICDHIANGYSSTEMHGSRITNDEMVGDRIESVGKPIIGQRLRIIDEGGAPTDTVPTGDVGEIIIKGPDAPVWAWNNTEKTEQAFREGWWYSGDLGYTDEDGYVYLEGRADFMITSKGMKVFPSPIEERLNAHQAVEESAVVGVEDEEYGEKVTAIVQRTDADLTADELDEWCLDSDKLARFERPRTYHFTDEPIPHTATGKLDRRGAMDLLSQ